MAEKGAEYTRGKWQKEKNMTGAYNITSEHKDNLNFIAEVYRHFNAKLICSAVNACISINPENPQAAADGMEEVIKSLKGVSWCLRNQDIKGGINWKQVEQDINQALSKITEGK